MGAPNWELVQHLLGEWGGSATEIVVTDLPRSQIQHVVSVLAELPELNVLSFGYEGLDPSEPFDEAWRKRIAATQAVSCQHALRSANGTAEHLQIYLWFDGPQLEVELVFWNDMTFPPSLSPGEYERRTHRLVSLAEACRAGVTGARCVLSTEWNGTPEELLNRPGVVVW